MNICFYKLIFSYMNEDIDGQINILDFGGFFFLGVKFDQSLNRKVLKLKLHSTVFKLPIGLKLTKDR